MCDVVIREKPFTVNLKRVFPVGCGPARDIMDAVRHGPVLVVVEPAKDGQK